MKILELLKKYVMEGKSVDFKTLYMLGKVKGFYSNKTDFEIDLELAMEQGLVGCARINNENRFFRI
jgi:hypothetical protein